MREIKFRVWSDFWEKYADFEAELYMDGSVDADFEDDNGIPHHETTDLITELYTGLKDKNGKEIYEGDIVEYSWVFCGIKRKNKYAVGWLSGKVEHYPYSVDSGFTLPDSVDGYMVVGNIHENPELLEK